MSALRCCVCPRWVAASPAGHMPCRGADSPSTQHPVPGVRPAPPWPVPPTPRPVSQAGPPGKMPAELAARSRVTSARGNATPCRLESHSVPRGGAGCGRRTRLVLSVLVPPSCGLLLAAGIRLPPSVRPPRGPGRRGLRPLGSRVGEQDVCASGLRPARPQLSGAVRVAPGRRWAINRGVGRGRGGRGCWSSARSDGAAWPLQAPGGEGTAPPASPRAGDASHALQGRAWCLRLQDAVGAPTAWCAGLTPRPRRAQLTVLRRGVARGPAASGRSAASSPVSQGAGGRPMGLPHGVPFPPQWNHSCGPRASPSGAQASGSGPAGPGWPSRAASRCRCTAAPHARPAPGRAAASGSGGSGCWASTGHPRTAGFHSEFPLRDSVSRTAVPGHWPTGLQTPSLGDQLGGGSAHLCRSVRPPGMAGGAGTACASGGPWGPGLTHTSLRRGWGAVRKRGPGPWVGAQTPTGETERGRPLPPLHTRTRMAAAEKLCMCVCAHAGACVRECVYMQVRLFVCACACKSASACVCTWASSERTGNRDRPRVAATVCGPHARAAVPLRSSEGAVGSAGPGVLARTEDRGALPRV